MTSDETPSALGIGILKGLFDETAKYRRSRQMVNQQFPQALYPAGLGPGFCRK